MVGIAFQGGGIKGSYEIGAYFALKECRIKVKGFCGTSIGSFNAAVLACGKEKELLNFWKKLNPGEILGLDSVFVEGIINNQKNPKFIGSAIKNLATIIKNRGIDTTIIKKKLDSLVDEDLLRNSKYDFGIVTVKLKSFVPLMLFKEDIPLGKLKESVLASCYLPIFKAENIIDNHRYLDGGFYDNCPVNMLIGKGYKKIYAIKDNGIGINRKVVENDAEIISIEPTRMLCSILELDQTKIRENIILGYFDAMRILKKMDGYKYTFIPKKERYFKWLTRKIEKKELTRVMNFFKTKTVKETVIKALEYLMEKDSIDYYQNYHYRQIIKKCRRLESKHFINIFINKLSK